MPGNVTHHRTRRQTHLIWMYSPRLKPGSLKVHRSNDDTVLEDNGVTTAFKRQSSRIYPYKITSPSPVSSRAGTAFSLRHCLPKRRAVPALQQPNQRTGHCENTSAFAADAELPLTLGLWEVGYSIINMLGPIYSTFNTRLRHVTYVFSALTSDRIVFIPPLPKEQTIIMYIQCNLYRPNYLFKCVISFQNVHI